MFEFPETYDVIIVGSGHAGIEAAMASARLGCRTLMVTQNLDTVGQMSCNPAIGGSAKGQIVREIDALGGVMGINADATGIQFRMLNTSKGPSVQAPRVQCDKKAYQFRMKAILEGTANLHLKQATVLEVIVRDGQVQGVAMDFGLVAHSRSVVITSGTFLRGLLHVGGDSRPGGRMADATSALSENLRGLGFTVGRFKTGTPCRIDGRSINFEKCKIQRGDEPPPRFAFFPEDAHSANGPFTLNDVRRDAFHVEQLPCWITGTTRKTHEIITANLHRSPLYSGQIKGTGPRYCPSIEDKVVRFADRESHHLFLEPEGRQTHEYYVNGISTSLPYEVQFEFVRSIPGLEQAELMRPGYAVEYDFFPPTQLLHTLETKAVGNLFFAGQVNGTSGYEEAAAQGLIAGANAALSAQHRPAFILERDQSYIGVLIDDLVTKGTDEPYRMFTSRAEARLTLRHDNADRRLTPIAARLGLVSGARVEALNAKVELLHECRRRLRETRLGSVSALQALKRPEMSHRDLPETVRAVAPDPLWQTIEADIKSEGYAIRQTQQNRELSRRSGQPIPDGFDFTHVPGLSSETRQKLAEVRPTTVAAAARISGVTPADLSILHIWLSRSDLQRRPSIARAVELEA
jgi:tRNA uridine 5-carboxymethylaminomethyl modification enzyme